MAIEQGSAMGWDETGILVPGCKIPNLGDFTFLWGMVVSRGVGIGFVWDP